MAYIPDDAIDRLSELTKTARHLYIFLTRCRNQKNGRCHPSVGHTMTQLSCNRATVFTLRRELTAKQWARFEGDNVTFLLGFNSPTIQTAHADNKANTPDSPTFQTPIPPSPESQTENATNTGDSQQSPESWTRNGDSPESQTPDVDAATFTQQSPTFQTVNGHTQLESNFLDLHIRKNQQTTILKEKKEEYREVGTSPVTNLPLADSNGHSQEGEVWRHWQTKCGHPKSPLTAVRKRAIANRLKEGFTVADLCLAVDGCRASEWHMGKNPNHKRYDDITLICRDAPHVESFIADAERAASAANGLRQDWTWKAQDYTLEQRFTLKTCGYWESPMSERQRDQAFEVASWLAGKLDRETGRGGTPQKFLAYWDTTERKEPPYPRDISRHWDRYMAFLEQTGGVQQ